MLNERARVSDAADEGQKCWVNHRSSQAQQNSPAKPLPQGLTLAPNAISGWARACIHGPQQSALSFPSDPKVDR